MSKRSAAEREVLELRAQRDATSDIMRAISASADPQSVFDIIVLHAARLCDAHFALVLLHRDARLVMAAHTQATPELIRYAAGGIPLDRGTTSGRAAMQRRPVQILDFLADPEAVISDSQRAEPIRTVLAMPMLGRDGALLGTITIWRREVRAFEARQVEILETFCSQAVVAIENARLLRAINDKSAQLELASTYKSRFLAAASHDLRQPLHALNLFVAQLRAAPEGPQRTRLTAQIDSAVSAMNGLFNALLDMSRLDAGVMACEVSDFPLAAVLERIETTFRGAAREKGLELVVVASDAWVRSDAILLERILLNLVSNAVRYTSRGGVVVGARRRGERLRIDVWDTGSGIPQDQREKVFSEFYRLAADEPDRRGGLGLGLAIVDRLSRLLDHPIEVSSTPGKGSRFSVTVPWVTAGEIVQAPSPPQTIADPAAGKVIVVIDDDELVLEGMRGILASWGCKVATARSAAEALRCVDDLGAPPDLVISDYRLNDGANGIEAIEAVRRATGSPVPAFLISGDTGAERLREAAASSYPLLHKPVRAMKLRAVLSSLLGKERPAELVPGP